MEVFLLFFLEAFFSEARASGPTWPITETPRFWILGEGNSHFNIDGTYFYTRENYDGQGSPSSPLAQDQVRYSNLRLNGGFGFTPRLSLYAQADLRGLFLLNANNSNVSDDDNYGFGDAFVGGRWLLYRSSPTDRVYPTEWSPETWIALVEGTWLFPMYDRANRGKPPLGNQSNDFTGMIRTAWYASDWLALSANAGYTFRTSSYRPVFPWGLRADFNFEKLNRIRFWLDFQAQESLGDTSLLVNPSQPDPIPGGSLLFKSYGPNIRTAMLGLAHRIGKEWEAALAGSVTASGIHAAKGWGASLGFVWRPYQIPELTYEEYRQEQIRRLQREPRRYRQRAVLRYGFQATVLKVSEKGNFFQIGFGQTDGVKAGDLFQVFAPDDLRGNFRSPLALARVQVARLKDSFLRVDQRYDPKLELEPGYEVRRVILEE